MFVRRRNDNKRVGTYFVQALHPLGSLGYRTDWWSWWRSTKDARCGPLSAKTRNQVSLPHDHIHERAQDSSPSPTDRAPHIRRRGTRPMPTGVFLGEFFPDLGVEFEEFEINVQLR